MFAYQISFHFLHIIHISLLILIFFEYNLTPCGAQSENVSNMETKMTTVSSLEMPSLTTQESDNNNSSRKTDLKNSSTDKYKVVSITEEDEQFLTEDDPAWTEEDTLTRTEWGGNCTSKHWNKCKFIKRWLTWKCIDEYDSEKKETICEVDCVLEPVLCMRNGWTVNRCHLLCMGRCNRRLMNKFDKYVSHEGECKATSHG